MALEQMEGVIHGYEFPHELNRGLKEVKYSTFNGCIWSSVKIGSACDGEMNKKIVINSSNLQNFCCHLIFRGKLSPCQEKGNIWKLLRSFQTVVTFDAMKVSIYDFLQYVWFGHLSCSYLAHLVGLEPFKEKRHSGSLSDTSFYVFLFGHFLNCSGQPT